MKIKITEPGWAGYTGHFGMVEFKDGVSVEDLGRGDAAAIAALVAVEEVETGKNPSEAQRIVDGQNNVAPVEAVFVHTPVAPVSSTAHTKASLEELADKHGIKAMREIGETFGVKGTSISELIEKILTAQALAVAAAAKAE